MTKPKLLYVSINDGSDTRISKEVRSLSQQFDIHYFGIGKNTNQSFIKDDCRQFTVTKGHHKQPLVFLKYYLLVVQKLLSHRYYSIHIINENLLLIFLPFLWFFRKKIVLDIFDSIFLRSGKAGFLQKLSYQTPRLLIVTDDNRKSLLPTKFHRKTVVVENFPYRFMETASKVSRPDELLIFYNGSMSKSRGTEILQQLLKKNSNLTIKMAGWVYDDITEQLSKHPQVEFLGVISQKESMRVAATCDYILSLYEPVNKNNINASPNKIYDAIQAGTPVIINREVKIASFVEQKKIGYVMESFYSTDDSVLLNELMVHKESFFFDSELRNTYTWETIEGKLIDAHRR